MQTWTPVVPQGRQVPAEQKRVAMLQLSSEQHALPLSPQSMTSQMLSRSSKPELQGETPSSARIMHHFTAAHSMSCTQCVHTNC